ncbi:MAG: hypothetical protein GX879_10060 [Bacteroidales bacterium]|nr:hypothetical protein [Bacteroidales bacterium]
MDDREFQELKKDIKAYRDAKNEILKKIETIKQEVREDKKLPWIVDTTRDELYKELVQSDVRHKFSELAKKAGLDPNFEKHFRSAHLETFFGVVINPKDL